MQNAGSVSPELGTLLALAKDGTDAGRTHLFLSISDLFEREDARISPSERALMREIMRRLIHQVEMSVRSSLALRLAEVENAPHDLILMLANDRIEIAQVVLQRSRVLTEADLVAIVRSATTAHQKLVAGRPDVTETVASALAESTADDVIAVLLANSAARIARDTFLSLADRSRDNPSLQESLLKRDGLPPEVARKLYDCVSDTLRSFIATHFAIDAGAIGTALSAAANDAKATGAALPNDLLIEKMATAGQLKPAFLIKALNQSQMDLFEIGMARLLRLPRDSVQTLLYKKNAFFLALACRGLGIDRSVFASVFAQTRAFANLPMLLSPHDKLESERVFKTMTAQAAIDKLKMGLAA